MLQRPLLFCTVDTSQVYPNLAGLRKTLAEDPTRPEGKQLFSALLRPTAECLADAHDAKDSVAVTSALGGLPLLSGSGRCPKR